MNEAERRAVLEIIDILWHAGYNKPATGAPYEAVNKLMELLHVGPEYQEDGE